MALRLLLSLCEYFRPFFSNSSFFFSTVGTKATAQRNANSTIVTAVLAPPGGRKTAGRLHEEVEVNL